MRDVLCFICEVEVAVKDLDEVVLKSVTLILRVSFWLLVLQQWWLKRTSPSF